MEKDSFSGAREHIEKIRRETFYIGRDEKNPLAKMVHGTVNYLSEELYCKDVHFLMELIQNAEDNEYPAGVAPSLEFIITSKDITATGASATLFVFNNERGFSAANIESICAAAMSTKKGNRHRGYIGEKGIGFKSVFLISSQPHIFSNGYQIKFNEEPCPECNIGYIVPEWVEHPTLSDIEHVYGPSKILPTTVIILPLKADKVQPVKDQLSKMHPEILLFLSKIKQLAVREVNDDPRLNTVSQISISSETDVQMRKNIFAESYTRHLTAQENDKGKEEECSYYMWKQNFPVKSECRDDKRLEVDEWMITLAFPWTQRLNRGSTMPGVYSFLPTEMETNFPFIIQADFLLNSSRESILFDKPWNKGILECVPAAFINAFVSLVKSTDTAPSSCITSMFRFLPVQNTIPLLDFVRLAIKERVVAEHIIPCESQTAQKIFSKPDEVGRLMPDFWDILEKAKKMRVDLKNLSSHGTYVLSSSFDKEEYGEVLNFLGVKFVGKQWYGKCIESSNLVKEVTEEVYLDLLYFLADNWRDFFDGTNMQTIPLIKYVGSNGITSFWSIHRATQWNDRICIASDKQYTSSWLISWNREFGSCADLHFVPQSMQTALEAHSKEATIVDWLKKCARVQVLDLYDYGRKALAGLANDRRLVIVFAHFLYHSRSKGYLSEWAVRDLCSSMTLVDNYGRVIAQRKEVLVPAKGSKWVGLMGSNPWRSENYVELAADYLSPGNFAGNYTSQDQLLAFLRDHINASDVPEIRPPNAPFDTVSSPLTKENTFLLLDWIRNLKYRGIQIPLRFLDCIKRGSWLKTSVGYKPPSESFLSNSDWGSLLQMESVLVDIPMINQGLYDNKLDSYKDELRLIGVRFEFGEASSYIGNHLMAMATYSTLTRANVISLLKLIRLMRKKQLPPEHLISSVKDIRWLKTSNGYRSPVGSVLKNSEWTTASYISALPFIDQGFYGGEILEYATELELLGVLVRFNYNHQLVIDNFRLTYPVTADAAVLILECIRYANSSERFVRSLRELRLIKTHLGYKTPSESFLVDSEWECLLEVVDEVPLIDQAFYGGRLASYQEELKKTGVLVKFEEASKAIANRFKLLSSSSSLTKKNVIALLSCYRQLKEKHYRFPADLTNCMYSEKWLHTRMGFRSPKESILYDPQWEPVSQIAALPFIDDTDAYYGKEIHEYKDELKALGASVEFKDGAHFVVASLNFPKDPSVVTVPSVLSLLKCIRNLKEKKMENFPKEFMRSINKKWLKTVMGYKCPGECILFDSKWEAFLQRGDGPFIDEDFYGSEITAYREELKEIGVILECGNGCSVIAGYLECHSQSIVIARVYKYLMHFKWEPEDGASDLIWIPNGNEEGKWVGSDSCVIHDNDNLFSSQLYALEKYYKEYGHLLGFFSMVLKVKNGPTIEDYCKLWNMWESSLYQPAEAECSAFWVFIAKHWNVKKTSLLLERITKVPVLSGNGIVLSNKQDTFIPDDLLLKDLCDEASEESIFIWYPPTSLPSISRAKMNSIFSSIGVRTISEAIEKQQSSLQCTDVRKLDSEDTVIKTGLLKIVLGFLADPSLDICAENRQHIVKCLLESSVLETDEPITMSYTLPLSSGKNLSVKASRIIWWEREGSELFIQKIDRSSEQKANIEFATYFSEVIAEGLLFDRADQIAALTDLIKLGCLLDFDDVAVGFLLKSKNLQIFAEDEEFLSSAFSSIKA